MRVEFRSAEGSRDRLAGLAAELIGLKVGSSGCLPATGRLCCKGCNPRDADRHLGGRSARNRSGRQSRPAGRQHHGLRLRRLRKRLQDARNACARSFRVRRVAALMNAPDPFTGRSWSNCSVAAARWGVRDRDPQCATRQRSSRRPLRPEAKRRAAAGVVQPSLPRVPSSRWRSKYRVPPLRRRAFAALAAW